MEELFEDGTISFLSIASIHHGFKILNSLTESAISRYVIVCYFHNAFYTVRKINLFRTNVSFVQKCIFFSVFILFRYNLSSVVSAYTHLICSTA